VSNSSLLFSSQIISVLICFVFLLPNSYCQNLENLSSPALSISGNISVGTSFYQAYNRESRRSPISYFISGNPTFSIYGYDIPISITYRESQGSISNPFNRLSFNPKYKWVALNAGKFTKTLSEYSLSGQVISGGAIDLTPGKFRLSFVAGNMQNALLQVDTLLNDIELLPSYKRKTIGGKIGFGTRTNYIDFVGFKAKDDINSLNQSKENLVRNRPQENIVLGTKFGLSPFRWLTFTAELSASAHTANQESGDYLISDDIVALKENYESLLTINQSSKLQYAGNTRIDFKFRNFGFGGEYKRVDPLYKSLGSFYFQEDYENFLFKLNLKSSRGLFRFRGQVGLQKNNLNNLREVTNSRRLLNTSITIVPSNNFTLIARYSNFQTERSPGLVAINDSLRFARATASYGVTPRFVFGSKERMSTITVSYNHQTLEDLLDEELTGNQIKNNTANLTYGLALKESGNRFTISLIGNRNLIQDTERERVGINIGYAKSMKDKKLQLNFGTGAFVNFLDSASEGYSASGRIGIRYKVNKSVNLSSMINFINRSGDTGYQEIRGNLRFSYRIPKVSTSKSKKTINSKK
jgi:hypothetical protein